MERSLVRKVVVDAVEPIENADAIEAVRIGGWRVVCRKGDFSEGDVVLFFEVDSALNPHDDRYAFLKERCYKQFNLHGKLFDECLRIRTIRLRGVYSQGLVLNPDDFCEVRNKKVGEDCTAELAVRHYDEVAERAVRETQPFIAANQKGLFPPYGPKTDEPRIQNLTDDDLMNALDIPFEVTEKIDGSSLTIMYIPSERPDDPIAVCSRNYEMKDMPGAYWDIVHALDLDNKLKAWCDANHRELMIQGELNGPGIQNNRDNRAERGLDVFRIWDVTEQRFLSPSERYAICEALGISHVPVLETVTLRRFLDTSDPCNMQKIRDAVLLYADGHTARGNLREGVVFKQVEGGDFHFKAVSNRYLEKLK